MSCASFFCALKCTSGCNGVRVRVPVRFEWRGLIPFLKNNAPHTAPEHTAPGGRTNLTTFGTTWWG